MMQDGVYNRWRLGVLLSRTLAPFSCLGDDLHVAVLPVAADSSCLEVTVSLRTGRYEGQTLVHRSVVLSTPQRMLEAVVDADWERLIFVAQSKGVTTVSASGSVQAALARDDLLKAG